MTPSKGRDRAPGNPAQGRSRDWWDKAEIIGKILTGLLPAILVAAIGYFGQHFTQSLENTRLYTELLTRREQADTDLRRNMFSVLMKEFLASTARVASTGEAEPVVALVSRSSASRKGEAKPVPALAQQFDKFENDFLKLELLATNFAESLTLSPLFEKLDRDLSKIEQHIKESSPSDKLRFELRAKGLRKRLVGLAQRISENQIAAIKAVGNAFTISVTPTAAGKEFFWPFDDPNLNEKAGQGAALGPGEVKCGNIVRSFQILFSEPDTKRQRVRVQLSASKVADLSVEPWSPFSSQSAPVENPETVEKKFTLDFFNFPLIDNTRLSDDQRLALVMTHFDDNEIVATALCFSGTYSSVRDRPFINEIIESLSH